MYAPSIPWLGFINGILKPHHTANENETVLVMGLPYFRRLEKLLYETPKKVITNYVYWRAVQTVSSWDEYLNNELQELQLNKIEKLSRSETCLKFLQKNLPLATGALYVRKNFDETKKKAVLEVFFDLLRSFNTTLKTVSTR